MRKVLLALGLSVFGFSYGDDTALLNQEKAYLLQVIHDKVSALQNMEICVDQAQSWKDLKSCKLYRLYGDCPSYPPYPNPYYPPPPPWYFNR